MKQESSAPTGQTTRSDGSARPTPWAPVAPPATSAPAPSGARRQFPRWAVLTPVALLAGAGLGQWLTPLVGQVSGSQVWGGAAVGAVVATLVALGLPWLARALAPKASAAVAPPPAAQVVPAQKTGKNNCRQVGLDDQSAAKRLSEYCQLDCACAHAVEISVERQGQPAKLRKICPDF